MGFTPAELAIIIAAALVAPVVTFAFRVTRAAREGIRWKAKVLSIAFLGYFGATCLALGLGEEPGVAVVIGVLAGALAGNSVPKRSRYIPAAVRREVKNQFELESGRKYNPQHHELDHIVPFSRGGSHTVDNLRVIKKKANRRKGKRMPSYDEIVP